MSDLLTFSPPGALDTGTKSFAGAKATFFNAGTTTPRTVYTDQAETIPAASPLVADAAGLWPEVFVSGGAVKAVVTYSDDSTAYTLDPCTKVAASGAGAASISFAPSAGLAATNVQDALDELATRTEGSAQLAGRNRIINGQGRINQRGYVSGTATVGANQYTLDRWRVVTSGQNLTFTGTDAGRTMTAPAGGCEQVIEGANIEGGTYVINWTGTATCTVNGTARGKGESFTLTANTNATVRMIGGTFTDVQLELGSVATPFERLPISEEVARCQRYLYQIGGVSGVPWASPGLAGAGNSRAAVFFPVTMRAAPSLGVTGTGFQATDNTLGPVTATVSLTTASPFSANLSYSHAALTANAVRSLLTSDATSFLRFDSEL